MVGARFVGVLAATMLLMGILTWLETPVTGPLVPYDHLPALVQTLVDLFQNDTPQFADVMRSVPLPVWIFVAGAVCAAVVATFGILAGYTPRLLVLFVGLSPFAALGLALYRSAEEMDAGPLAGLRGMRDGVAEALSGFDFTSPDAYWRAAQPFLDVLGPGALGYLAIALLLVLLSLVLPADE